MFGSITKTATWKQSQITVAGTVINGLLGALFYILMARFLGPSDFGLLTISVATLTLIADSVDFGTNTGLVRYISANINKDSDKALKYLKLGLEFKVAVWIIVLILGYFLSPVIAQSVFKKIELVTPLRLVMIGVGGALLLSFATASLQAYQKYYIWSLINISTNFMRLVVIFLLFYFGYLNLFSIFFAYILLPFFGFCLSLLFLPYKSMFNVKNEFSVANELIKYNLWVGLFTIIAAISSRLDTFISARLLSNFDLGIYGSANQLVQIVPQMVGALGIVAAPKFASFANKHDMIKYLKKFQLLVLGLSVLGLLAIPLSFFLIPLIYGTQYQSAILPFIILLIAMLVFLISVPIHNSIIYYYAKPNVFVWVSIGHLILMAGFGYILISKLGVTGAAFSVLIGMLFNFLIPLGWLLNKIRK